MQAADKLHLVSISDNSDPINAYPNSVKVAATPHLFDTADRPKIGRAFHFLDGLSDLLKY